MVLAGQGQDDKSTNTILEWNQLGINLGRMDPRVAEIRERVATVLDDTKYRRNAVEMSINFKRYDVGRVFDAVVQKEVRKWRRRAWKGAIGWGRVVGGLWQRRRTAAEGAIICKSFFFRLTSCFLRLPHTALRRVQRKVARPCR
jgi:hypothetical protein